MHIEDYCDKDGKYAENGQFVLKRLQENDKENYMNLKMNTSSIPKAYENEVFFEETWKNSLRDKDLNLSLFTKDTNLYLGNLMLKNFSSDIQEIGIDIVREYRNKGVGYKAVELLMNHAKAVSGASEFEVKVYSDNVASKRLFENLVL